MQNLKNITVNIAPADHDSLDARDYSGAQVVVNPDNAPMTFYAAQDEAGKIVGSVQVGAADRKAVAALVGNWIAQGYPVSRMTYKAMNKVLREQQKALDAEGRIDPPVALAPVPAPAPAPATPSWVGALPAPAIQAATDESLVE